MQNDSFAPREPKLCNLGFVIGRRIDAHVDFSAAFFEMDLVHHLVNEIDPAPACRKYILTYDRAWDG